MASGHTESLKGVMGKNDPKLTASLEGVKMLNFNQLRVFYSVVRNQSVTLAARELYITQPTASNHVKGLEESLGIRLFEKKGIRIRPTEAGEKLSAYAKQIFDYEKEFENAIQQIKASS